MTRTRSYPPQVIVVNMMVGGAKGKMIGRGRIEAYAAHVRFALNDIYGRALVRAPDLNCIAWGVAMKFDLPKRKPLRCL